jgi:prephenate dehydratase
VSRTVAFLGPPGTYSDEAMQASGTGETGIEGVPVPTVRDALLAVQEGRVDRAIVPIESATEGAVNETLDTLAVDAPGVTIVREVVHPVHVHLIGREPLALADAEVVLSHPQALAQCAGFLRRELPHARLEPAPSTSQAVRDLPAGAVALGTRRAAELHGRVVLREDVEDNPDNETRFVWVARAGTPPDGAAAKTSVVFWGGGASAPGWLVRCLSEFAFRGVNLTRIESRPRKQALGAYMFFLDCGGGAEDDAVAGALEGLRAHCEGVRVLGSYPAA